MTKLLSKEELQIVIGKLDAEYNDEVKKINDNSDYSKGKKLRCIGHLNQRVEIRRIEEEQKKLYFKQLRKDGYNNINTIWKNYNQKYNKKNPVIWKSDFYEILKPYLIDDMYCKPDETLELCKKELSKKKRENKERSKSITAYNLAEKLDISSATLRKYCKGKYSYPSKKYKGTFVQLYTENQVKKIRDSKWLNELYEKREQIIRNNITISEYYKDKYTEDELALKASHAMFNLNRYCKHSTCTRPNKEEMYSLKDALLKKLFKNGYVVSAIFLKDAIKKECFSCNGTGIYNSGYYDDDCDYDDDDDVCWKCNGTGIYYSQSFWLLRFVVGGETFTWHTPQKDGFDYKEINADMLESDGNVEQEVKPLNVPKAKLTELKRIVDAYVTY